MDSKNLLDGNTVDRVILGFNGEIDSIVSTRILQEHGFHVIGVLVEMGTSDDVAKQKAINAAKTLEIGLHLKKCDDKIINLFETLAECADEAGIDYIATGHFAQIDSVNGKLVPFYDEEFEESQSSSLEGLSQDILNRLVLPLGDFTKDDVMAVALESKLI